jgi:hypothetical protein
MNYKEVIESKYNRQKWQLLLHDIFGSRADLWASPYEINTNSSMAKQAFWLGTITLADDETIAVYEVELSDKVDIERNRRGIRDMLLTEWRNRDAGAFMFCYRKNESVLRFSYVSEAWNFADDGSYTKESTDTKRFTYLLGEGHRSRTAIQQFEKLKASQLKLKDLTKAFSVEAVSDMFFNEYKKNYEDIIQYITGKRMVKVANKWEEKVMNEPCQEIMQEFAHFPNPEKSVRDYVKKLMGRLVFLQFLQKKGWLGVPANEPWGNGNPEFIQGLFAACADKDHFVDNVLEELFNDLNTERANDLVSSAVGHNIRVPYLNGGLFEREATDETEFPLPAKYMQQMLDFFASYNFTIDENDPDDAEVGVDPEMLGRIFENLLEDNKDKGAFYTPKEIVTYMCRESLIAYLQTDIEDEVTKEAIRQFVITHEKNDKLPADTDQKLKDVKICDPAIGSGAFPMGLLKELFQCRTALDGIEQSKAAEIKKHIIQNNIYGVDIERGAVDIARLRFWLSLIVDEENPQALPNLDYKIVEGNSLITTFDGHYIDLEKGKGEARFRSSLINIQKEKKLLQEEQKRFFTLTGDEKYKSEIAIKMHILNTIWYQLDFEKHSWKEATIEQAGLFGSIETQGRKNNKAQVAEFTPERQKVLDKCVAIQAILNDTKESLPKRATTIIPFFEWKTVFSNIFDEDKPAGFDIVIANPPYVLVQTLNNPELEALYKNKYTVASYKIDLYHLFIETGYNLLKESGILTYITPTNYLTNNYNQPLRDLLLKKTSIKGIVNIEDNVFEASVNTGILIVKKETLPNNLCYYSAGFNDSKLSISLISSINQDEYLKAQKHIIQPIGSSISYELTQKIENKADSLKQHASVNFGMQLRNRKYYTNDVIVSYDSKLPSPFHRKCLTGKDVSPYITTWNNRYCYFNEDARCGGCWAESVHNAKNKIIVRQVGSTPVCGMDKSGLAVLNSAFMIVCNDIDPFGVLGIINSKLMKYYWKQKFEDKRKTFPKIKGTYLELLPIASPTSEISTIVKLIIDKKEKGSTEDTSTLEKEIDGLVYKLYDLTDDEIRIIEDSFIKEQ